MEGRGRRDIVRGLLEVTGPEASGRIHGPTRRAEVGGAREGLVTEPEGAGTGGGGGGGGCCVARIDGTGEGRARLAKRKEAAKGHRFLPISM